MKEILIFAGTTEGRQLSENLAETGIFHTICVATEYGEIVLNENPFMKVHCGRMNQEEIRAFIQNGDYAAVVDATHPYAVIITENIKSAMQGMKIPYLRLKRDMADTGIHREAIRCFNTNEECIKALKKIEGKILLTTGSKELKEYCNSETLKSRLYVRVLPGVESLSICVEHGIKGKQIIAMQGPFTVEMNEAIIHQYGISCIVTKQSGTSGGYMEKLEAAKRAGIPVFVIGHPKDEGYTFAEICEILEKLLKKKIQPGGQLQITLAGIGMGEKNNLTEEVQDAIRDADILFGAERMIAPYEPRLEKKPYYQAEQIVSYLEELQEKKLCWKSKNAVILFSGDSGFYSGCQNLYQALKREIETGKLRASVRILPGISSVAYLAACIGESYQDAVILSMHGKNICNLAHRIKIEQKTYLLMSGVEDVRKLGRILKGAGMTKCEIVTGYQMSYSNQQIKILTPEECCELQEEGLYTCFIKNPDALQKKLTHGMVDENFIRNKVPMTKEEVREVSICKLRLRNNAIVYDIGSGTGSVAVEIAELSNDLQVYAIEQKEEAVSLIKRNIEKFGLENITVVETKAPEGMINLPRATHAFIGGSGGKLKEILETLYQINPEMRVVINAISMETISEIKEILSLYPKKNEEIIQMQVNRAKVAGSYHLMQAENPVWICSFQFYR